MRLGHVQPALAGRRTSQPKIARAFEIFASVNICRCGKRRVALIGIYW